MPFKRAPNCATGPRRARDKDTARLRPDLTHAIATIFPSCPPARSAAWTSEAAAFSRRPTAKAVAGLCPVVGSYPGNNFTDSWARVIAFFAAHLGATVRR